MTRTLPRATVESETVCTECLALTGQAWASRLHDDPGECGNWPEHAEDEHHEPSRALQVITTAILPLPEATA